METIKRRLTHLVIAICGAIGIMGTSESDAAVVATDISNSEYQGLLGSSSISWQVDMTAGFPSTSTTEITVNANGNKSLHHSWSYPEQVEIGYNSLGELNIRVGSTVVYKDTVPSLQPFTPTTPFNALLIRIGDASFFGPTRLIDSSINSVDLRDLYADDGNTLVHQYDQLLITNLDSTFSFKTTFDLNPAAFSNESLFSITGIHVPEPSSFLLFGAASFAMIFRRVRPTGTHR